MWVRQGPAGQTTQNQCSSVLKRGMVRMWWEWTHITWAGGNGQRSGVGRDSIMIVWWKHLAFKVMLYCVFQPQMYVHFISVFGLHTYYHHLYFSCHWPCPVLQTSSPRCQAHSLLPLSAPKNNTISSQTSIDNRETQLDTDAEACGVEEQIRALSSPQSPTGSLVVIKRRLLEKESDESRSGWCWTVGDNCYTAQWVKHKQEYRSTRPWWWLVVGSKFCYDYQMKHSFYHCRQFNSVLKLKQICSVSFSGVHYHWLLAPNLTSGTKLFSSKEAPITLPDFKEES